MNILWYLDEGHGASKHGERHLKTEQVYVSSCKVTKAIMGTQTSWPHVLLIASQRPYVQMPLRWEFLDEVSSI